MSKIKATQLVFNFILEQKTNEEKEKNAIFSFSNWTCFGWTMLLLVSDISSRL
jgi:hypothetical protein